MIMEVWDEYIADVRSGARVEGSLMRRCVERFEELRERDDVEFDVLRVRRVIRFFGLLKHFKGKTAGRPFKLQPWQEFIVAYVYGLWKNGRRLVRRVYIEESRKNGKTAFAAGLAMYHALGDAEPGAEVDLAANSKEQAKIAYEFCSTYAEQLDRRGSRLKCMRDRVLDRRSKSKLQVFASDDTKLDGFDASMYLLDEYHAARDSGLFNVLQSSQGARENPLGVVITTAGFNKLGPCYEYRTSAIEVLKGVRDDDQLAVFIYAMDEDDAWDDARNWRKCNPNLGVTVHEDYIATEIRRAKNQASEEVNVRTKTLNEWCDSETVWIPDHYIVDATEKITPGEGAWDDAEIEWYGGIDLNATSDLAAFGIVGKRPDGDTVWSWCKYYLPRESLKEHRFRALYALWEKMGALTVTPGNVTDYDIILRDIREMDARCRFQKIAYDAWNATQFVINAESQGLPMEPFSQALGSFNRPTKEVERLLLSGKMKIDNNVINRHCYRNVVLAIDRNGNCKPTKQFVEKKIDGVIAMLEALGVMLNSTRYSTGL